LTGCCEACSVGATRRSALASKRTGQELRRFFLELLEDKNLERYYKNRSGYIERRARGKRGGYLSPKTQELLQSDALREIEDSVMLITGSKAVPLWVVCPPM
jgi:hypothetical protein